MPETASSNPIETSLNGIGFTEDANAGDTEAPQATEEVEETPTETAESEETAEESLAEGTEEETPAEEEAETTEEEEPSGYDAMLPNQQLRNYPEELYALAAKKFGVDPSLLSQQSIRDLLKGKIDSDIDNRGLRERLEAYSDEETEPEAEEEPAAEPERAPQAITPESQLQATYRFLREGQDGRSPIITKEGAKIYADAQLSAYTALQEALDSGDAKKIEAAQVQFAETQAAFATVMFANVFPALLPHMLQAMPEQLWDGMVGAKLEQREEMRDVHREAREILAQDPRYADINSLVKSKAIYNFVLENPEVLEKQYFDVNRRPIRDPIKLAVAQYKSVIHALRGQNYRPPAEYVKQGMRAGERHARELADRKAASKGIGGGARTRGIIGTSQDRYDPTNWVERMKKAVENSDPLGTFLRNSQK